MKKRAEQLPDWAPLRGVVAPEILRAAEVASEKLREAEIPHALAGGLAVGAHGYPRTTDDVDFLVGDEAFVTHAGGVVTLKLPLIAVGGVRVDFVSIEESKGEDAYLRPAVDRPPTSEDMPIVPLEVLVFMKLKAGRQKDVADVVELLKRGNVDVEAVGRFLENNAPGLTWKWERSRELAAEEE